MSNSEKNLDIDKSRERSMANLLPNMGRFSFSPQPTPEAKSQGWQRKKAAQAMMDKIEKYSQLTVKELNDLFQDIKENPGSYTVDDVRTLFYVRSTMESGKFVLDWLDRHVSKAPQEIKQDITSGGEKIIPILGGITHEETKKEEDRGENLNA